MSVTFRTGRPGGQPRLVSRNRQITDPKSRRKKHTDLVSPEVISALKAKVEEMSGLGIPIADIARSCGISQSVLYRYYGESLDKGRIAANASVANQLFERCHAKDKSAVTAQMFWLSRRAGWTERQHVEHAGRVEVTKVERIIVDPD